MATLSFQDVIMALHRFWAEQGCLLWQPYNIQVGAGTSNPATLLRVLGPEPWRVAYVEPSVRPDDGRYAENPNRLQTFYQYQVVLKPDPGNPQELYLQSLQAIGIDPQQHDIRFVEDNWENPTIGAWGLGWEVWLDGQEITQFTYFQAAGGLPLDKVAIEITYGLERIVLALQNKNAAWEIEWTPGVLYADVFKRSEWEYSTYYFELADIESLKKVYDTYEHESHRALADGLVLPAYDYILKCSHLFNVLDTRGAIGVTERASYFRRMRDMTRAVAKAYAEQRKALNYPLNENGKSWQIAAPLAPIDISGESKAAPDSAADVLLEIGTEELPPGDLGDALAHLKSVVPTLFNTLSLAHGAIDIMGTPRRLVIMVHGVAPMQPDREEVVRGPSASVAFNAEGKPTKAAEGFAKKQGVSVESLEKQTIDGGEYVTAHVKTPGTPALQALSKALPELIGGIKFVKSMRWNHTNVQFSRPIRWITAMLGGALIPFEYAEIPACNQTRGTRPEGSPALRINDAAHYLTTLAERGIILSHEARREKIWTDAQQLAAEVGGVLIRDESLLAEVANLVEQPTALRGTFDSKFLDLPLEVLVTVMRKHQRYFAVTAPDGKLLPYFIAIRNGGSQHLDEVIKGNEHVLIARFSDADFFFRDDRQHKLIDFLPRLQTLIVQDKLGSMYDKNTRLVTLVTPLSSLLHLSDADQQIAHEAARVAKADLATRMVVEMTALQGIMGREYATREGYAPAVAQAIFEGNLPRTAGDQLPQSSAGVLIALADRLDSLVGLFAAGLIPTASADPYGLRRAALGIVQILLDRSLDVDLRTLIDQVAEKLPLSVSPSVRAEALAFIAGRLRIWLLEEEKLPFDAVEAVLAEQAHNPYRALQGARELAAWVAHADWPQTLDAYARCVRITRKEPETYTLEPLHLTPAESLNLYMAAAAVQLSPADNVDVFLRTFQPMIPAITAFFDNVLVMDDDMAIRQNRLALLQYVAGLAKGRADLSKLNGF